MFQNSKGSELTLTSINFGEIIVFVVKDKYALIGFINKTVLRLIFRLILGFNGLKSWLTIAVS